jgi:lysine N6-hydroxylase
MKQQTPEMIDAVGIGIGPFNLSLAAMIQPLDEMRSRFFDRRSHFDWHPGLLFPEATIQVSFLKDLVTLADPTSAYSFLSFLFENKRLYRFINADFARVTRMEFNQYLRWVCASLPNLEFGRGVETMLFDGESLVVELEDETVRTKNIILGTGLTPVIPACALPHVGTTVLHASRFLKQHLQTGGKRVAVVGGGQTGGEVFNHLLSDHALMPCEISWISRRPNFQPLDESPFTNDLFTPNYSDYFFSLPRAEKNAILAQQKLASDGISGDLLALIYQRLYQIEFLNGNNRVCNLLPQQELIAMSSSGEGWLLKLRNGMNNEEETLEVDIVVLCTGSEYRQPKYLDQMNGLISMEPGGGFKMREDFSIVWDGPPEFNIYVQNAARHTRGVADPNLSLMAWRSATILNSLAGREIHALKDSSTVFDWMLMEAVA